MSDLFDDLKEFEFLADKLDRCIRSNANVLPRIVPLFRTINDRRLGKIPVGVSGFKVGFSKQKKAGGKMSDDDDLVMPSYIAFKVIAFDKGQGKYLLGPSSQVLQFNGCEIWPLSKSSPKDDQTIYVDFQDDILIIKISNIPVNVSWKACNSTNSGYIKNIGVFDHETRQAIGKPFLAELFMFDENKNKQAADEPEVFLTYHLKFDNRLLTLDASLVLESERPSSLTKTEAIVISHHPFAVNRIRKIQPNAGAGERLAYWKYTSESREPAQWMFPIDAATVDFPPQAIGEEMERGSRFWTNPEIPDIQGDKPIRFNFAPNAQFVLVPSDIESRRYHTSPLSLLDFTRRVDIQSFKVEAAYPLQMMYTKRAGSSQNTIQLTEISLHIKSPAQPLPSPLQAINTIEDISKKNPKNAEKVLSGMVTSFFDTQTSSAQIGWSSSLANVDLKPYKDLTILFERYQYKQQTHLTLLSSLTHRLAEFPLLNKGNIKQPLDLKEGLSFKIRSCVDGEGAAANVKNPLPLDQQYQIGQTSGLQEILDKFFSQADGLPIGILHTFEMLSELQAVLQNPTSSEGTINNLTVSALGATGSFAASFDRGRTTFQVDVADGQISRLVKTRIGRIANLHNKAKHVVVYDRTTVPPLQFRYEQGEPLPSKNQRNLIKGKDLPKLAPKLKLGWPILRKSEEYIELLEMRRYFKAEQYADLNRIPILHSSAFPLPRIYVNGAWATNLALGYKLPLWDEADRTGFYPKPQVNLCCYAGNDEESLTDNLCKEPHHIYFYSSTDPAYDADTDKWPNIVGIDGSDTTNVDQLCSFIPKVSVKSIVDATVQPNFNIENLRDPRFTLAVQAQGKCNLLKDRVKTTTTPATDQSSNVQEVLLASPHYITIGRIQQKPLNKETLDRSLKVNVNTPPLKDLIIPAGFNTSSLNTAAALRNVEDLLRQIPAELAKVVEPFNFGGAEKKCGELKELLKARVDAIIKEAITGLKTAEIEGHKVGEEVVGKVGDRLNGYTDKYKQLLQPATQICNTIQQQLSLTYTQLAAPLIDMQKTITTLQGQIGKFATEDDRKKYIQILQTLLQSQIWVLLNQIHTTVKYQQAQLQQYDLAKEIKALNLALKQVQLDPKLVTNALSAIDADVNDVMAEFKELKKKIHKQQSDLLTAFFESAPIVKTKEDLAQYRAKVSKNLPVYLQKLISKIDPDPINTFKSKVDEKLGAALKGVLDAVDLQALKDQWRIFYTDNPNIGTQLVNEINSELKLEIDGLIAALNKILALNNYIFAAIASDKVETALSSLALTAIFDLLWALIPGGAPQPQSSTYDSRDNYYNVTYLSAVCVNLTLEQIAAAKPVLQAKLADLSTHLNNASKNLEGFKNNVIGWLPSLPTEKDPVLDAIKEVTAAAQEVCTQAETRLVDAGEAAKDLIHELDCTTFGVIADKVADSLNSTVDWAKQELSDGVAGLLDQETKQRLQDMHDRIAAAVKNGNKLYEEYLPKANAGMVMWNMFTDPPQLPNMDVNTVIFSVAFGDDSIIRNSPCAARIRQAGEAMHALGLDAAFDGLGDSLKLIELPTQPFDDIFKSLAGMKSLFKGFGACGMPEGAIKITHGLDKAKREAWTKATVQHQYGPEPKSVFDAGIIALAISKMKIDAATEVRTDDKLVFTHSTHVEINGDWRLNLSQQPMVTFRNVSLKHSSEHDFSFNFDPSNIEVHPALKFVTKLMNQAKEAIPPELDVVRAENGKVIGLKYDYLDQFPGFEMAGMSIGPFAIASGFGLLMENADLTMMTSFSLGTRESPVMLQYGVYGGGGWIVASAKYDKGKVIPYAQVGIALGSSRNLNLGNVARGRYSISIFFNATFGAGHQYIETGISVHGHASILGVVNASISILLLISYNGDNMKGTGRIDVEIDICWCYTLKVHRQVQQQF